jgi:hypothetical protein
MFDISGEDVFEDADMLNIAIEVVEGLFPAPAAAPPYSA